MNTSSINNLAAQIGAPAEIAAPRVADAEERTLIQAVRAVNGAGLFGPERELSFVVDRNTRRAVVRIVNRETREVIDQIPAEYLLRLAEEVNRK